MAKTYVDGEPKKKSVAIISLPKKRSAVVSNLAETSILLYGKEGIGKSSLVNEFPNVIFGSTDRRLKGLDVFQNHIPDWNRFKAWIKLLRTEEHEYKTACLDLVDDLYVMALNYVCEEKGVEHPSDKKDYGKTWGAVEKEFASQIRLLESIPMTVIAISLEDVKEFVRRDDSSYNSIAPSMSKQAYRFIKQNFDFIFYYGYEEERKKLVVRGGESIATKVGLNDRFMTIDDKEIRSILCGDKPKETYQKLLKAFNNKQEKRGTIPYVNPKRRQGKA